MGKVTVSNPHSKQELQERVKATRGFWRVQKWLVIWKEEKPAPLR